MSLTLDTWEGEARCSAAQGQPGQLSGTLLQEKLTERGSELNGRALA